MTVTSVRFLFFFLVVCCRIVTDVVGCTRSRVCLSIRQRHKDYDRVVHLLSQFDLIALQEVLKEDVMVRSWPFLHVREVEHTESLTRAITSRSPFWCRRCRAMNFASALKLAR